MTIKSCTYEGLPKVRVTCDVCDVTGLNNGGKKLTLTSLRYLIRRGDEYDDSKYGKFKRELSVATDAKARAIAQLRLDTLHTYTHPNGTVYHIFEGGVINGDYYCRVCSTCHNTVSYYQLHSEILDINDVMQCTIDNHQMTCDVELRLLMY